jgi:hypothetical protein
MFHRPPTNPCADLWDHFKTLTPWRVMWQGLYRFDPPFMGGGVKPAPLILSHAAGDPHHPSPRKRCCRKTHDHRRF